MTVSEREPEILADLQQSDVESKDDDDIRNVIEMSESVVANGKIVENGHDKKEEKTNKKKPIVRVEVRSMDLFIIRRFINR